MKPRESSAPVNVKQQSKTNGSKEQKVLSKALTVIAKLDELHVKFCTVLKIMGKMKGLSDYVKFPREFMLEFLQLVNGDQLIEHERAQKEGRANVVREVSEKQLEFATVLRRHQVEHACEPRTCEPLQVAGRQWRVHQAVAS